MYESGQSNDQILMVSCQKGPSRHAYAWPIGPFWQDTLDIFMMSNVMFVHNCQLQLPLDKRPCILFRLFDIFVKSRGNAIYIDWHISTKCGSILMWMCPEEEFWTIIEICQKCCINGKIMRQGVFIMLIVAELNANVSYYKFFRFLTCFCQTFVSSVMVPRFSDTP